MQIRFSGALALFFLSSALIAESLPEIPWGKFDPVEGQAGVYNAQIPPQTEAGKLPIPVGFPNVVRATMGGKSVPLEFNADATEIALAVEKGSGGELTLEIAEGTIQQSDGRIVFSALDAVVDGEKAALESHPGNHRIGFWNNVEDVVRWDYKSTRPGMYDVFLTYSLAGGGSKVSIAYGADASVETELTATGSWYAYHTVAAGRLYLEKDGKTPLVVTPIKKTGGAVMNLKAVLLVPAPEGKPIVQKEGDPILLHARDSTTHGVKLRWEPKAEKQCVGYWANPADWASWDFEVAQSGTYRVVVRQGCGKGHGGSEVQILVRDQKIDFTVEDTGGFQNWKDLKVGEFKLSSGSQKLEVRPVTKAKVAVMDIRHIELIRIGD